MTVKELIKRLSEYEDDLPVGYYLDEDFYEVEEVYDMAKGKSVFREGPFLVLST